jgi:sugar phosphate permease
VNERPQFSQSKIDADTLLQVFAQPLCLQMNTHSDDLQRVIRKVAWRVVSLMFITYVFNLLDRVNMSNAQNELREAVGNRRFLSLDVVHIFL